LRHRSKSSKRDHSTIHNKSTVQIKEGEKKSTNGKEEKNIIERK
jgi:hypothetical protein